MSVAIYKQRNPQSTPLYFLVDSLYDKVKAVWEDRFERVYGFWRAFLDDIVMRYLDCGLVEFGFARVFCEQWPGGPGRLPLPGLPQIRTCTISASGSSVYGFAAQRYML